MTKPIALPEEFKPFLAPIFERKAKSIVAIKVTDLTSYADMIVIAEGGSQRQVTALAEHVIMRLKQDKIKALGVEGIKEGEWALIDFGHIIIHVFESQAKAFYDLEGLWSDAPRHDLTEFGPLEEEDHGI